MSVFRQPWEKHDYRGALDSGLVYYLFRKYFAPRPTQSTALVLETFPGGKVTEETAKLLNVPFRKLRFPEEDALEPLEAPNSTFGIFAHPPYWKAIKYTNSEKDLCNCATYEEYVRQLGYSLEAATLITQPQGWIIYINGDYRKDQVLYPLHSDMMQYAKEKLPQLTLRDYTVWELSASSTPNLATPYMIQINWAVVWQKTGGGLDALW